MRAVVLGTASEVKNLLVAGADISATDAWQRTPFLLSIMHRRLRQVQAALGRWSKHRRERTLR